MQTLAGHRPETGSLKLLRSTSSPRRVRAPTASRSAPPAVSVAEQGREHADPNDGSSLVDVLRGRAGKDHVGTLRTQSRDTG
jgi:hypothetical protein